MATDDLKTLMQELKISSEKEVDGAVSSDVLTSLIESLTKEGVDRRSLSEQLVEHGITKVLVSCLQGKANPLIQCKAAELVAELTKTDVARHPCSDPSLVSQLVDLLLNDDQQVAVQACRALGNVCYENDRGRSLVNEHRGTETLLQLLKNCLSRKDGSDQLRAIATGFLLNLTNTYELTQEKVLDAGVINVLCEYLERYWQDEDLCTHVLLTVNCITDSELGRQKIMGTNMCPTLISLLGKKITSDVVDTVLELLGNLAESDTMKFQLASSNLCQTLIQLIREHSDKADDDWCNITKTACELIILLLTGDDSMVHLYNDGTGTTYTESVAWLTSTEETLQVAGALAIGNFARKDEHCIQMVEHGITSKLIDVLRCHNSQEGDIRLQHAILSALRNLAIPGGNKELMVSSGVVDVILPMSAIQTFPVVFKLLGTLRMLVDKQDTIACRLGQDEGFLPRLIEWCETDDHPGVKGEANRLLAWIVKNSNSSSTVRRVIDGGGLPYLVAMASSEFAVMQNEALIALAIIAAIMVNSEELASSANDLVTVGLIDQVKKLLQDDVSAPEVKANTLALVGALAKSGQILETLKTNDVESVVTALSSDTSEVISEAAKKAKELFESG